MKKRFPLLCDVKYTGLKWNAATDYSKSVLHIEKLYIYVDSMSL